MALELELSPETEEELRQAAAAEGIDISLFLREAVEARLRQRAPAHRLTEAELLASINGGFPESFWNRYRALIAKRRSETLTAKERRELISLSDQIEARNVARIGYLTELAKRRGVPVRALMAELGLHSVSVE